MKTKQLLITLLMCCVSISMSAVEWTDANGTVWKFSTSGSNATLSGSSFTPCISGTIPTNLTIPSTVYIDDTPYTVTAIGSYAFYGCSSLTSINIPEGVTSIGNWAFEDCTSLTSINIPESVKTIGNDAFNFCRSLTSINIPDGVTTIGEYAFCNCYMRTINIPASVTTIGGGALMNFTKIHFLSATPNITYTSWPENATLFVPNDAVDAYKAAWSNYANRIVPETSAAYVYNVTTTAQDNESNLIVNIGEENAQNVVNLKVSGTFNSYDVMVMRNKMINLRDLDLSEARVVENSYKYYDNYYTKNNVITGYFAPTSVESLKLPTGITALEGSAFQDCGYLSTMDLPEGISSIPTYAFCHCYSLTSLIIPESVTSIGDRAFYECYRLPFLHLPTNLKSIGSQTFYYCSAMTELHLPPYLESIGDNAFSMCSKLKTIYAYMPDIIPIGTNTFNDYKHQELNVPEFLYRNYYYDTNWSQFLSVSKTNLSPDDYVKVPTNSDIIYAEGEERIPKKSNGEPVDGELKNQGAYTVKGEVPQPFNEVEQNLNGEGQGGSLIADGGFSDTNNNMPVNTLKVKIQVKANRWYFFCFPFDVTIADCEYPGQYAWRTYNSTKRAGGYIGWENVTGSTLTARQGYIFQSSANGKLIITFNQPTFGGDRPKPLVSYTTGNGNAADASWNFVGNPYSCFYEFDENDFTSPITVWNGTGYEAYRPGDDDYHLQPYEAFFVQKPSDVEQIAFGKDRRETYRQSQEKKTHQAKMRKAQGIQAERLLINLNIGDQETENIDRTRLVLNENASRKYELECDAAKFISDQADAQLYMVENGVQMAINERPTKGDIRMGYKAKKAGTLRIEASRMDLPMMLVDTKTNQTFDLSLGSYEFETEAGTFNSRFMLRPSDEATAIKELTAKTGVAIGTQDGGLSIGGAEGKIISIYTTNGAQVAQQAGNGFVGLPSGLYLVTVDSQSAKIYVK